MCEVLNEAKKSEFTLGIRPEYLGVSTSSRETDANWYSFTCKLVEPIGNRLLLHLNLNGGTLKAKTDPGFKPPRIGEKVWLHIPLDSVKIFNKKTGKLIL